MDRSTHVGVGANAMQQLQGSHNVAIGKYAAWRLTTGSGNCLVGIEAGADLTTESGVTIIGDYIRSLDPAKNSGVLFIGDNVAIGETLFGVPFDLKARLEEFVPAHSQVHT